MTKLEITELIMRLEEDNQCITDDNCEIYVTLEHEEIDVIIKALTLLQEIDISCDDL